MAADSAGAQAVKVAARAHKTLIWERARQVQRLRHALRDYFPAALEAFDDLAAPDALELLARAPVPAAAAKLTTAQVSAALKRARRRNIKQRTAAIRAALRSQQLAQPMAVTAAYAATFRSLTAVITTLNEQIQAMEGWPSSRRSSLEPAKINVKGGAFGTVIRDLLRSPLTLIMSGTIRAYQEDDQA